jgi:U32 family peptidase
MADKKIGEITHYYSKLGVGIIKLNGPLAVGDKIRVEGSTTNFEQEVGQIQVERKDVTEAKKGEEVGVKISEKVRTGDSVFLV